MDLIPLNRPYGHHITACRSGAAFFKTGGCNEFAQVGNSLNEQNRGTTANRCLWCGGYGLEQAHILSEKFGLSLMVCFECETWQWSLQNHKDAVNRGPLLLEEISVRKSGEYKKYAAAMVPFMNCGDQVLSIGPGAERLLDFLPQSLNAVAHSTSWIAGGDEKSFPIFQSLAALVLDRSLDRLSAPGIFISRALHWVKPGGLVLIAGLANPNCFTAKAYQEAFRFWHPCRRIYLPPATLTGLLEVHGFEIIESWRPYLELPEGSPVNFIKYLPRVLAAFLGAAASTPPPLWPGDFYSIMARKTVLFNPLPALGQKSAKLATRAAVATLRQQ